MIDFSSFPIYAYGAGGGVLGFAVIYGGIHWYTGYRHRRYEKEVLQRFKTFHRSVLIEELSTMLQQRTRKNDNMIGWHQAINHYVRETLLNEPDERKWLQCEHHLTRWVHDMLLTYKTHEWYVFYIRNQQKESPEWSVLFSDISHDVLRRYLPACIIENSDKLLDDKLITPENLQKKILYWQRWLS